MAFKLLLDINWRSMWATIIITSTYTFHFSIIILLLFIFLLLFCFNVLTCWSNIFGTYTFHFSIIIISTFFYSLFDNCWPLYLLSLGHCLSWIYKYFVIYLSFLYDPNLQKKENHYGSSSSLNVRKYLCILWIKFWTYLKLC